jgi:leader peptidase (prepilin peptidase)/N-methyltransferase
MTPTHHALLAAWFLVLGSCVGSFLNVCVHRIPLGLSLLRPRSRCPRCQAAIRARDNLPVLGWLMLRGKCRDCHGDIPARYVLVELGVGLLYAGVYLAGIACSANDPWEELGALGVLARLLAAWVVIDGVVVAALIAYDAWRVPGAVATEGAGERVG